MLLCTVIRPEPRLSERPSSPSFALWFFSAFTIPEEIHVPYRFLCR
ncbi:hypothetical protein HMPREF9004_1622 [Schaalia cardiffensis F0333]|uniref:Uncharacterized protein n=1 Tax=Schaalia cardiffensis F0333 TaxID=888050 RepID=N6X2R6_9ACTO|nr:hypothetical protein HMPREF9004_1622 [Schaalia cardiffensis F0333]